MKAAWMAIVAAFASVALARACPPVEPAEAERLKQVCAKVVTGEVETQFHAFTERASTATEGVGKLDHSALKAALEHAAAEARPSSVLLLVNVRYCRQSADPDAEDDCGPALNLLNTGLPNYDPNRETHAMLGGRRGIERSIAYRHPQAQPPAYAELHCLALAAAGEGSPPG